MDFNHTGPHLLSLPERRGQKQVTISCHDAASSGSRQKVSPDCYDLLITATVHAQRFNSHWSVSLGTGFLRERVDEVHVVPSMEGKQLVSEWKSPACGSSDNAPCPSLLNSLQQ